MARFEVRTFYKFFYINLIFDYLNIMISQITFYTFICLPTHVITDISIATLALPNPVDNTTPLKKEQLLESSRAKMTIFEHFNAYETKLETN